MLAYAAEAAHHSAPGIHFGLGGWQLVRWTIFVSALIIFLAYLFTRKKETGVPSKLQNVGEMIVESIHGMLKSNYGDELARKLLPFFGTFLIFLMVSNFFLIVPWGQPPTCDLSTTVALSVVALVTIHFLNFKFNGIIKALKGWFNPYPELTERKKPKEKVSIFKKIGGAFNFGLVWFIVSFLILLHVIDNGARLMSLSLRLFGNIFGEHVIFHRVTEVAIEKPLLIITLFIPFIILVMDTLIFMIQAFVFTYLNIFYLIEEAHIEH